MKKWSMIFLCLTLLQPSLVFADIDIGKIIDLVSDLNDLNKGQLRVNKDQLAEMRYILKGLTGTHTYGRDYYEAQFYDWGDGTESWQNLLALTHGKVTKGRLSNVIINLNREYPISAVSPQNPTEEQYYRLQAETTLASRSTSQLAFDRLVAEEKVMKQLIRQIDQAKDSKSSTDLNNRLVSEQNNISIEQAKLLAILVQQIAVDAQEKANRARENSEFFDYQ